MGAAGRGAWWELAVPNTCAILLARASRPPAWLARGVESVELEFQESPVTESERSVLLRDFDRSVWGTDAQAVWKELRRAGPIVEIRDDLVLATSTEAVEQVLGSPEPVLVQSRGWVFRVGNGRDPLANRPTPARGLPQSTGSTLFATKDGRTRTRGGIALE